MTKDDAQLFLPLVQAVADGKTIQCRHYMTGEWKDWGWSSDAGEAIFDSPPQSYRIKPGPVMVPLGPEDVTIGSAIRKKSWLGDGWAMVSTVGISGITSAYRPQGHLSWDDLREEYEIKRPGEDWKPCSKEGEQS